MSNELPPPPDIWSSTIPVIVAVEDPFASAPEVKPIGEGANAPADKEQDELAQLPSSMLGQFPDAAVPGIEHPLINPGFNTHAVASQEDFPTIPVQPWLKRAAVDPRLLNPHGTTGQKNVWPGLNGLPFRGEVKDIKEDDDIQPSRGYEVHAEILSLNTEKDLLRYTEILQIIANGFGALGIEERIYGEDIKSWRVLIRWYELYSYLPKSRSRS